MASTAALRIQIEDALATRFPAALTPAPRVIREVAATGIAAVDALLEGGLPVGAISELAGPECSGRTSLALAFVAQRTAEGQVCAWIDAGDAFDPESAAASGVRLRQLLWVRCGGSVAEKLDQALRGTDLLLQAGGFAAIVLDLGSLDPTQGMRIPLASWFRFRQAADRSRCSLLVLGRASFAQSSAAVVVDCAAVRAQHPGEQVLTAICFAYSRRRQRLMPQVTETRKPVAAIGAAHQAAEKLHDGMSCNKGTASAGPQRPDHNGRALAPEGCFSGFSLDFNPFSAASHAAWTAPAAWSAERSA
jgi:hypothetical protein